MKTALTIMKKELKRFFTDKRILISLFLPGIIICVIYSFMGSIMNDKITKPADHYNVYVENYPNNEIFESFKTQSPYNIKIVDEVYSLEKIKNLIKDEKIDLYIRFDENFMEKVNAYVTNPLIPAPLVEMYYYSAGINSNTIYTYFSTCLEMFEETISNKFDINRDTNIKYDLAESSDMTVKMLTMMLPLLLMAFLFASSMGLCADSIAGEKERGTIAALLITPTKRTDIVIGKVLALGLTSLASAVVSAIGLFISLPKLMGGSISLSSYGFGTILLTLLIIIITVLLFTALLTLISTYARTVKEATSLSMPLNIIIILVCMTNYMATTAVQTPVLYLIPIYNILQCFVQLFSLSVNPVTFIICILSNAVYIGIVVWLIGKSFNNEKIIFNK